MDLRGLTFKKFKGVYYALAYIGSEKGKKKKSWKWVLMDKADPILANTVFYYPSETMRLDQCIEHFLKENCHGRKK